MNILKTTPSPKIGEVRQTVSTKRIKTISASQQIHEALRDRIISLDLAPGQNLSRVEVSQTYGVSQTPVREAMQRLAEEGLLLIFPQSKTEVSRIDVDHAQETQFLRTCLELEVVSRLSNAEDRSFVSEISIIISRQERALDADDMDQFSYLDQTFHRLMCCLVGVEKLWDLITMRSGHIDRLRSLNLPDPGKSASIMHCHNQVLEAIKKGDSANATAIMRKHLSGTLAHLDDIRSRYPNYF